AHDQTGAVTLAHADRQASAAGRPRASDGHVGAVGRRWLAGGRLASGTDSGGALVDARPPGGALATVGERRADRGRTAAGLMHADLSRRTRGAAPGAGDAPAPAVPTRVAAPAPAPAGVGRAPAEVAAPAPIPAGVGRAPAGVAAPAVATPATAPRPAERAATTGGDRQSDRPDTNSFEPRSLHRARLQGPPSLEATRGPAPNLADLRGSRQPQLPKSRARRSYVGRSLPTPHRSIVRHWRQESARRDLCRRSAALTSCTTAPCG